MPGPSLADPLFAASQFTPTRWDGAEDKAAFANALCTFIARDFPAKLWTKRLYRRLSTTFQFIAHYDKFGFWQEYFADAAGKVAFAEQVVACPCHGDPARTYSDVERAVAARLRACDVLAVRRMLHSIEVEQDERDQLARLRERYDGLPAPRAPALTVPDPASRRRKRRPDDDPAGQRRLL